MSRTRYYMAMHANIKKLYISNLLTGFVFWYAIEKLFMQSIGIDAIGISINAVVFLAVIVLFDVPSGVLADKWRRKYTLLVAMLLLAASGIVMGFSTALPMYLAGTVLFGGYLVLTSGTYQAMMYDSLVETGQEAHYDKYQGRAYGLFLLGIGISSLAGGYIGQYIGLRQTFYLSVIPALITFIVLATTREPAHHKRTSDDKFIQHVRASCRVILAQPLTFHLALFLVIANMLRSTQNEFGGLYYIGLSLSAVAMGYANAGKWIAGAIGQFIAPYVGRTRSYTLLPWFFISYSLFSLITNLSGIVFFLIASMLFSLVANQAEAAIQDVVPSGLRATTLSVMSFTTNIIMIPLSLLFGWMAQNSDVFQAYQLFTFVGLLYLVVWYLGGRRAMLLQNMRTA